MHLFLVFGLVACVAAPNGNHLHIMDLGFVPSVTLEKKGGGEKIYISNDIHFVSHS